MYQTKVIHVYHYVSGSPGEYPCAWDGGVPGVSQQRDAGLHVDHHDPADPWCHPPEPHRHPPPCVCRGSRL